MDKRFEKVWAISEDVYISVHVCRTNGFYKVVCRHVEPHAEVQVDGPGFDKRSEAVEWLKDMNITDVLYTIVIERGIQARKLIEYMGRICKVDSNTFMETM